jgi:hypothetical protein
MKAAVRKLQVEDVEKLQALVVEHFDAIEPGLTVLDARLLLGHATIDVIGVDQGGALVLAAVGFTANEEMLLKAVEAYSWCLEYPESLVRLYPSCQLSEERPPRLLFVVERMPDAFHRKIKQLGFPEVDCVEVRHLEFDGVAAVYFETLLRLRRPGGPPRAAEPDIEGAVSAEPAADTRPSIPVGRAAAARLQKVTGGDTQTPGPRAQRAAPGRDTAPVVSMVSRQGAVVVRAERPRPTPEPVVLREPEPLMPETAPELVIAEAPEPVAARASIELPSLVGPSSPATEAGPFAGQPALTLESAVTAEDTIPAAQPAEPRVSFKDLAAALLGAAGASTAARATAAPSVHTTPEIGIAAPQGIVTPAGPAPVQPAAVVEPAEPIVPADLAPALTVEALVAGAAAVSAPASQPEPPVEPARPRVAALPQEFEGLKFPNDGVLTRQWMEFLNQMSGNK